MDALIWINLTKPGIVREIRIQINVKKEKDMSEAGVGVELNKIEPKPFFKINGYSVFIWSVAIIFVLIHVSERGFLING